jgi:IS605 OrfB family transposase
MQLRYRYRIKTRRKVAIVHNEVARARRDYHHKQALALVRENQVIHVEDLNIAGMVRNRRMARVISDAGWGQFVKIIGEKADRYGWTVHAVSRWLASSKTCSACGHRLAELPLQIRQWICPACRAVHDRDHNAAKVILAAGRAERLNACEGNGRRSRKQPQCGIAARESPHVKDRVASDHGKWQRSPRLEFERRPAAHFGDRNLGQFLCRGIGLGQLGGPVGTGARDPDLDTRIDCGRDRL